MNIPNI